MADSELVARRVATLAPWPCAGAGYLKGRPAIEQPSDLAEHLFIAHGHARETWRFIQGDALVEEFALRSSAPVVTEPEVVRTMLLHDAGIGVLPQPGSARANRLTLHDGA